MQPQPIYEDKVPSFKERLQTYNEVLEITHSYHIPDYQKDRTDLHFRFDNKGDDGRCFGVPFVSLFRMKVLQLVRLSSVKHVAFMTGYSETMISSNARRARYHLRGGFNYKPITNKKLDLNIDRKLVKTVSLSTTTGETNVKTSIISS